MYLNNRLARLERLTLPLNSDGFPPCAACENGSKKQVVYRFEGDEPLNLCPQCGYDRTGIAMSAVCPECGAAPTKA